MSRHVSFNLKKILEAIGFQGNLCCCLLSDSILGYSILTPRYLARLINFMDRKAVKELYERRR